jgi:hypothetical protein
LSKPQAFNETKVAMAWPGEISSFLDSRLCDVAAVDNEGRCGDLAEQRTNVHQREVADDCGRRAWTGAHALEPRAEYGIVSEVRHRRSQQLAAAPTRTHQIGKFRELLLGQTLPEHGRPCRDAVLQHQLLDMLGVFDRESDCRERTIGFAAHRYSIDADRLEHGEGIVDPVVEIGLPPFGH